MSNTKSPIIERKEPPLTIPPEIPPKFVNKLLSASRQLGNIGFAFRGTSSIPRYQQPGAPKPSFVKAKISTNGAAQGYLVVDSEILGRIEKDGRIRQHGAYDLPRDSKGNISLPQVQGKQTLEFFIEGLNSRPPKFELLEGSPSPAGKLQVRAVSEHKHVNTTIFSIDLVEKKSTPPLPGVRPEDMSSQEKILFPKPTWWKSEFGEWEKQLAHDYPVSYQPHLSPEAKPMMVYGLSDEYKNTIPIISDQDLLWITIPKKLSDALPEDAKRVINASKNEEGMPIGMVEMMTALVKVGKDLEKITGIPALFSDEDEVPNKVAGFGCMTPLEAYIAITVNKEFGVDIAHIRDLIQHGPENRNPYAPSDLNDKINHIGIDANGKNFVIQTPNERELVKFVLKTPGFIDNNVFDVHKGWDMSLWAPVIEHQKTVKNYPIPHATLDSFNQYKATHSFQAIRASVVLKTASSESKEPSLSEEKRWHDLEKICREQGWIVEKYDNKNGKIKLNANKSSIDIEENGLYSRESSAEIVNAMAQIFRTFFPDKNISVRGEDKEAKEALMRQIQEPLTTDPSPKLKH